MRGLPSSTISSDCGGAYARFRAAMSAHGLLDYCYCSTLGDCWVVEDRSPPAKPVVRELSECPRIPDTEAFGD